MRYRFQTFSAAQYLIDTEAMTWMRRNWINPNAAHIIGLENVESGELTSPPLIEIGRRAFLDIRLADGTTNFIYTTEVQNIELL